MVTFVIQTLVPYVSSEDIDKGARWSTDIAKELEGSTFGILCVTRDNINAPWLTFEAGALSKTMDKAFVTPFLFDIKRSEVDGPILQFQSTIFQKGDIKKLIKTLNKACDKDKLSDEMLDKAFDVWYPTLEEELKKIKMEQEVKDTEQVQLSGESIPSEILEEILELSRLNQKLLQNPDVNILSSLEELKEYIREIKRKIHRQPDSPVMRLPRRFDPMFIEELVHISPRFKNRLIGLQIALSLF